MTTPLSNQIDILGELWIKYRAHPQFQDFTEYNDLGLPLSYLISSEIVSLTPKAQMFIEETWSVFLEALGIDDTGFDSLDEMLDVAE